MDDNITVHRVVKSRKREGQYIEPHSHRFFHFIYLLSGHITVAVGEEKFQAGQRALIMVPPDVIHAITSLDTSISLDVKFSCSPGLKKRIAAFPRMISTVSDQANALMRSVLEEAVGQAPGHEEMIDLRLYELLLLLRRERGCGEHAWQTGSCPSGASENASMRRILQMIEEGLESPLRVTDLAERCGYSSNYFRLFFKEHVGIAPNSYINQRKIARAKEMMLYLDLNVTQISERLGYQSIHYFSRRFHQLTGISPTEYIGRVKDNRPINLVHNENTPIGEFELPVRDPVPTESKREVQTKREEEHEYEHQIAGHCPL